MKLHIILVGLSMAIGLGVPAAAQAISAQQCDTTTRPERTPSADFIDLLDGSVLHKKTGLQWQRCLFGQTWDGTACTDANNTFVGNWQEALQAVAGSGLSSSGWRMPSVTELESIMEYCNTRVTFISGVADGSNGLLNPEVFPIVDTLDVTYIESLWSSTPMRVDGDNLVYVLDFYITDVNPSGIHARNSQSGSVSSILLVRDNN